MKNEHKLSVILQGAMILSIASLISKILSAIYRVPFQNLVGNVGFYVFQQVYPIYGMGMVLALSGLPMIISRLIAEQEDKNRQKALLRQIIVILLIIGVVSFIFLQLEAVHIARFMGDVNLTGLVRAVSWMFLMMPFLASMRGYFQATLEMRPTAYSQVVEQIVRVAIIIAVAYLGTRWSWSAYTIGKYAMLAAPVAEIFSIAILIKYYWRDVKTLPRLKAVTYGKLWHQLWFQGGTICLLSSLMVLMQLIDSFTVRKGLLLSGMSLIQSQSVKGVYDRGQPLVQLGLVIATSFASAILPSLSMAYKEKKKASFRDLSSEMLRVSMFMTAGVATGMISLMPFINRLLFNSSQQNLTLCVFMLSVVLTTLITIYSSILQSANHFKITIISIMVGVLVKLLITQPLVVYLKIMGASVSTVISLAVMLLLEVCLSPRTIVYVEQKFSFGAKLVSMSIIMLVTELIFSRAMMYLHIMHSLRMYSIVELMILVPIGILVFVGLAFKWNLLSDTEWKSVPVINKYLNK